MTKIDQKHDRRVVRTRQRLRDALIELILEKGHDNISVREIVERADVGRATFYLHFEDKEDLLRKSLQALFDDLVAHIEVTMPAADQINPPVLEVFRHASANSRLYKILLSGRGSIDILRQVREYLAQRVAERIATVLPDGHPLQLDIVSHYHGGALLMLVSWWIDEGMPYSAEKMAEQFQQLAINGLLNTIVQQANQPLP